MQWSPLIVTMAFLSLVVSVACGGESKPTPSPTATFALSPTPSPTATSAPSPTTSPAVVRRERSSLTPDQEALLPEVSAPAGLGTVAWANNFLESSALFERLPSEIAGHRIKAPEESEPGVFSTTYEEDPEIRVSVLDLAKGDFFPTDTKTGQFVAFYAQLPQWEVLAAGREGELAWVQWKTGGSIYMMQWGNAPSSIVFQAMANDLSVLMALVEAMVSAASG